jgi:cyanophycinase
MDSSGSSRYRPARVNLRPGVEALEGRTCLSASLLHPLAQHASTAERGNGQAGVHHPPGHHLHHSMPSVVHSASGGHRTQPGLQSLSSEAPTATNLTGGDAYKYTRIGNAADASPPNELGGLAIQGGGTDIDALFRWMGSRMGGPGDFLVIRATDDTGYNPYINDLAIPNVNSIATLDIPNRAAALNPAVKQIIENAEAVFIAGGNQADYVTGWKGTPVQDAINDDLGRGVPLGGTSAGTDVIGQFIFSALHDTINSSDALNNPFNNRLTLDENFVTSPQVSFLQNTILDTHLVARDRMGRLVAFLARIDTNMWSPDQKPRGIGINQETALEITPDGVATVISNSGAPDANAYFLQTPHAADVCVKGVPLTYRSINVTRVSSGGSFNLNTWVGDTGHTHTYTISATNGVLAPDDPSESIY